MAHSARFALVVSLIVLLAGCHGPTDQPYKIAHKYPVADPQFTRTVGNLLGPPIVAGNSIETLVNGEHMFPAMLDAIKAAQKTINVETFIYSTGDVGEAFANALSERAQHGVKVHIILDGIGAEAGTAKYVKQLKAAGARVELYHPLHLFALSILQNRNDRTHRKLLIVDGTIGFTGGAGLSDKWDGNADGKDHWRDTHYRVTGPVVAQLQAAFCDNWMQTTGRVLEGNDYFPALPETGKEAAQVFKSSPDTGSESMELLYLLSIAAAEKNIRLATAYFVPDNLAIQALLEARKRGVDVQIIVPGPDIDVKIVGPASRAKWGELLKAGVRIAAYQPTMYHVKQMIVDDRWVSIGSANLDNLSFRLNDEANLNVLDREFAQGQIKLFEDDLAHSKQITYQDWQNRPLGERMEEFFASIFGGLM